jgi:hypothetical protein
MPEPEDVTKSSPDNAPLLQFQFPAQKPVNVYVIEDEDGNVIARTEEEIKKMQEGKKT